MVPPNLARVVIRVQLELEADAEAAFWIDTLYSNELEVFHAV